jgi:transcriptional regulator with GAF, ATPase, and Fis domain
MGRLKDKPMNQGTSGLAWFSLFRTPRSIMEEERVSLKEKLSGMERAAILEALKAAGWVKAKAARELGMTERMIGYKIKKYGIGKEGLEDTRGETSAHYHKGGRRPQ